MIQRLIFAMIDYYAGDPKRIQHFLKVHSFAKLIGQREGLDGSALRTLEAAAVVHDIGIKIAEQKFNSSAGKYQEQEGVQPAYDMLTALGFDIGCVQRVCYLVGHHHTYDAVDGSDYQILIEADFLVNLYEDGASEAAVRAAYEKIFRTQAGKQLCRTIFSI